MAKKIENYSEISKMEIGDKIKFDIWDVFRIPNGWIYACDAGGSVMSVFVPNNSALNSISESLKEISKNVENFRLY